MAETKKHPTRRYRSPLMRVGKFISRWIVLKPLLKTQLRVRVYGRENLAGIDSKRAFIVISNHASHLDAVLIMTKLSWRLARKISTASAADFWFKSRLRSLPVRILMNTFPVERGETNRYKGLTGQLLEEGVPILVMPEGSRSRTGTIGEFKPGVAALSIKHQVPVVPVALVGTYAAWPPDSKLWRSGRPLVRARFGKPLLAKPGESVEKFNKRLRSTIIKLYDAEKSE